MVFFPVKCVLRRKPVGPGGCAVRAAPSQLLLRDGQRCWHSLDEKAPATLPCCYDSWMFQRSVRCLWWTMATSIYSDSGLEQIPGLVLFSKLLLEIWSVKQTKPPDTRAVCAGRDFSLGAHGVAEVLPLLCLVCILKHPFLHGQRALPSQYLVSRVGGIAYMAIHTFCPLGARAR